VPQHTASPFIHAIKAFHGNCRACLLLFAFVSLPTSNRPMIVSFAGLRSILIAPKARLDRSVSME
jgi:hypothetical protein